ncbi:MAG: ABC transporter permease subunit, partial [Chloroflexota bacterium]
SEHRRALPTSAAQGSLQRLSVLLAAHNASPFSSSSFNLSSLLLRLGALAVIDAVAVYLLYNMLRDGSIALSVVLAIVTVMLNVVFLREDLYPLRWISPGLALLIVMVAYPIVSTVYTAFTNYGDGHFLTKPLSIQLIEKETYLPEGAALYDWVAYLSPEGNYLLMLTNSETGETVVARPGVEPEPAVLSASGELPESVDGYQQLDKIARLRHTSQLVELEFGVPPNTFRVSDKQIGKAAQFQQRYTYDAERDLMVNNENGTLYRPVEGTFTADNGEILRPGFRVPIGARNFERLITSPGLRGPFLIVFVWTVAFAALSALTTFALGLFLAIMFDTPGMPFRKLTRSLILIPYAIPAFISVPIWVGLMNPQHGVFSLALAQIFGASPPWFTHAVWSKIGILLVNLWLGFPYMFVISTGALQALPTDVYEAADIDGANPRQKFWTITLPLLLISIGPLLVASFAYNFNNFVLIDLFNEGKPPMSGTATPVGHTDVLVTYTFRLAFSSGRGADLGYAAAITVAIFLILVVITYFQFRYTNMLEEVSENV